MSKFELFPGFKTPPNSPKREITPRPKEDKIQMRFDGKVYRDCPRCNGRGCGACPAEADAEYNRQFPDGPKPIMTITAEEFDAAAISEITGGPNIESTHGMLGVLAAAVWELAKEKP